MSLLQLMNELEAINFMLISIGEQPVNYVDSEEISEATIARDILHQTSRQIQSIGLHCNSESNYALPLDENNHCVLPSNALKVDATDRRINTVRRGNRLYDKENHTYEFQESLKVDIVWFLAFTDLPQVVRDYIMVRATRLFQAKVLGSEVLHQFTYQDEMEARALMMIEEVDTGDYNVFNNTETLSMLRRY